MTDFIIGAFVIVLASVWYILTHLIFDISVVLLVVAALLWMILKRGPAGFFIGQRTGVEILHRKCSDCDSCGVVMVDGSIIPPENRTYQRVKGGYVQRGKIANTKTCLTCGGLGHVWIEGDVVRPISQNRRPTDTWR